MASLPSLPTELQQQILIRLPPSQIFHTIRLVSRHFCNVADDVLREIILPNLGPIHVQVPDDHSLPLARFHAARFHAEAWFGNLAFHCVLVSPAVGDEARYAFVQRFRDRPQKLRERQLKRRNHPDAKTSICWTSTTWQSLLSIAKSGFQRNKKTGTVTRRRKMVVREEEAGGPNGQLVWVVNWKIMMADLFKHHELNYALLNLRGEEEDGGFVDMNKNDPHVQEFIRRQREQLEREFELWEEEDEKYGDVVGDEELENIEDMEDMGEAEVRAWWESRVRKAMMARAQMEARMERELMEARMARTQEGEDVELGEHEGSEG